MRETVIFLLNLLKLNNKHKYLHFILVKSLCVYHILFSYIYIRIFRFFLYSIYIVFVCFYVVNMKLHRSYLCICDACICFDLFSCFIWVCYGCIECSYKFLWHLSVCCCVSWLYIIYWTIKLIPRKTIGYWLTDHLKLFHQILPPYKHNTITILEIFATFGNYLSISDALWTCL